MNNILAQLNSAPMYAICGGIIAFVAAVCVVFLVRSYRAGLAIGMDPARMKRAITSSATFSVLPSVGILLGVIALSGSLGTPWPWLRLSVIGALHYETQVAQAAAEQEYNDTPAEENAAEKPAAAHLVPEDLADMTVANLKKMAADMGIDTKALKTKDALIQAICAEEVYPGEPMDGPDLGAEAPVV